jgi:nucleoside-diphosphate-sugar epimerase
MAPALRDILRLPLVPLFGAGHNALPVVYAGNVAVATRLALEARRPATIYDVGLDHPLPQRDLMQWLAEGLGLRPRFVSLPAPIVRAVGGVLARFGVRTPGAKHLPIDRFTHLALGDNPHPSLLIRSELGWSPPFAHRSALERTGKWLTLYG